jgi:hypothetical protein
VNAKGFGDYTDGFSAINVTPTEGTPVPGCSVADDFTHAFGDPQEARVAAALRYRVDQTCPGPSGFGIASSLSIDSVAPLSAVDGPVPKNIWLQNRMMVR